MQFLGPAGRQLAPQESFDFPWLRIEKFGQDLCIVALPRQPGLQPVNVLGEYIVDDIGFHGFLTDLVCFFKRTLPPAV
jgi:hypothetical protein